jgi:NifU-like protein involved in Fe-S cluster formation
MTMTSLVLLKHIDRPFGNRTLPVEHGRGIVADEAGANAVKIAFTLDVNERLADVAFRSFGEPMLIGCASFLTEVLRGQTLSFARRVTARDLSTVLKLHPTEGIWAAMTVRALLRALRDFRTRRPTPPLATSVCGGDRGERFARPRASPEDRSLLRPGQTLDGLLHERACLCHALINLDLCLQVAMADSNHSTSIEGKWSTCSSILTVLKVTIPMLSRADRALLVRVGLHGETVRQASHALRVPETSVSERLWETARQMQALWRSPSARAMSGA